MSNPTVDSPLCGLLKCRTVECSPPAGGSRRTVDSPLCGQLKCRTVESFNAPYTCVDVGNRKTEDGRLLNWQQIPNPTCIFFNDFASRFCAALRITVRQFHNSTRVKRALISSTVPQFNAERSEALHSTQSVTLHASYRLPERNQQRMKAQFRPIPNSI